MRMSNARERARFTPNAAVLVTAAAALVAGTQAHGDIVSFVNPAEGEPGHFDWELWAGDGSPSTWLDITRPSTDQTGLVGPMSVGQVVTNFGNPPDVFNVTTSGASVVTGDIGLYPGFTVSLASGTEIDGSFTYASESIHAWWSFFFLETISHFADGEAGYMGVRFSDVDGDHYGWIGVVPHDLDPHVFDAFAWGYETEPMTPIAAGAVPAPGTLAALALGAAAALGRRKRKDA
jgi:hypothetical protein